MGPAPRNFLEGRNWTLPSTTAAESAFQPCPVTWAHSWVAEALASGRSTGLRAYA